MKTTSRPNRKVHLAFGAAMVSVLVVGALSYRGMLVSRESDQWVRHTHAVLAILQDVRFAMERIDASSRGFVLTGNESSLDSYRASVVSIGRAEATVRTLTVDNLDQQRQLSALETLVAQKIQRTEVVIGLRRTKGMQAAADAMQSEIGQQLMDAFQASVRAVQDEELRLLLLRDADATWRLGQTELMLALGIILSVLIAASAGWSVLRDNAKRIRVEEGLRQSEEQYRMLLDGVQDHAIFLLDPHGQIISWNAGAERIKGYAAAQIIGHNFACFFPPEDIQRGRPTEVLRLTAASGSHVEHGMRVRKDGSRFLAHVTFTALRDLAGNLRGFSEFSYDLSARQESEARYRGLLEAAPDAMVVVNQGGDIVLLNVQAERQFDYRRDELIGQPVTAIVPEGFAERLIADALRSAEDALAQQIGTGLELKGQRKNGSTFPIEIMLSPLESSEGILVTAAIRDITTRKKVEAHLQAEEALFVEKERAQVTLNSIGDAVACTDSTGTISFLNRVAEKLTGWSCEAAIGRPMADVLHIVDARSRARIPNPMAIAVGQNRTLHPQAPWILMRRDGVELPIEDSVAPIHDRSGQPSGAVIVFRDVSVARAMAQQLTHSAEHDFLTGLPNRLLLNDRVRAAIALAARHKNHVAVLFLDLDGFKHINDSLGHPIGDKLLQSIARRLVQCVRNADTVSRQGGDEFVVLLSEVERAEDVAMTARRMLQAVVTAHTIDQHDLHVTTSIGVSVYPDDGLDAETLIKNADTAMYQAKEAGRQDYRFFTPSMNVRAVERQAIEESLRRALERQEFVLHYQPKVDLRTGAITGAEALLRWTHPVRGPVSPAAFIPVAEDCGMIVPIGTWVLREACRQAQLWVAAGLPLVTMAVNISALEFRDAHFLDRVFAILTETGLDPRLLELELTESVLMKHAETTVAILTTLRARGVQVAVDDFGTGYSSLSYLSTFPIDVLKIDQSFVRQISTTPDETTIVTAVISMGRSLKLRVIAEGVETHAELAFLQAHHCDEVQGYYFSQPVLPLIFASLLETGISKAILLHTSMSPE